MVNTRGSSKTLDGNVAVKSNSRNNANLSTPQRERTASGSAAVHSVIGGESPAGHSIETLTMDGSVMNSSVSGDTPGGFCCMKECDQEAAKLNAANAVQSTETIEMEGSVIDGGTTCTLDGVKKGSTMFHARWLFAFLAFIGISCIHIMRLNLSVVMVTIAKTNRRTHFQSHDSNISKQTCIASEEMGIDMLSRGDDLNEVEFEWSSHTQELLLASFYIGYAIMQAPVGWLSDTFGGKWLFAVGVSISAIVNIVGPFIIRSSLPLFFATRVISGMAEAVAFPASNTLTTKWAPAKEKTTMTSLIVSGTGFGSAIGQFLSGMVCSFIGWEATFYIFGAACMLWVLLWIFLVYEDPGDHPFISAKERNIIEEERSRGSDVKLKTSIPLRAMMTSLPATAWCVYMVTIAGFVIFILLTNLPLYMKHVQRMDTAQIGFLLPIPYIVQCVMMMVTSSLSDMLIRRKLLEVTQTRKLATNIGAVVTSGSLLAVSHVGCSHERAVIFMTTAMGGVGIAFAGIFVNPQDLAPRFAGTLFGIGNTFSVSTGFVGPVIVGLFTEDQSDPEGWRNVFYTAAGLGLFGAIFFQVFGSGMKQDWAKCDTIIQFDKSNEITSEKMDLETIGIENCGHSIDTEV